MRTGREKEEEKMTLKTHTINFSSQDDDSGGSSSSNYIAVVMIIIETQFLQNNTVTHFFH